MFAGRFKVCGVNPNYDSVCLTKLHLLAGLFGTLRGLTFLGSCHPTECMHFYFEGVKTFVNWIHSLKDYSSPSYEGS